MKTSATFFLLASLFFFHSSGFAQSLSDANRWSDVLQIKSYTAQLKLLGKDGKDRYVVWHQNKDDEHGLRFFNKSMNEVEQLALIEGKDAKQHSVKYIDQKARTVRMLLVRHDKALEKWVLEAWLIPLSAPAEKKVKQLVSFTHEPDAIRVFPKPWTGDVAVLEFNNGFFYDDNVSVMEGGSKNALSLKASIASLDSAFNLRYHEPLRLPAYGEFTILEVAPLSDGKTFVAIRQEHAFKKFGTSYKKLAVTRDAFIYTFDQNGTAQSENLSNGKVLLHSIRVNNDPLDGLSIAGTCAKTKGGKLVEGIYALPLSTANAAAILGEMKTIRDKGISAVRNSKGFAEVEHSGLPGDLAHFHAESVQRDASDGAVWIFRRHFRVERLHYDHDILVCRISKEGNLDWYRHIPKTTAGGVAWWKYNTGPQYTWTDQGISILLLDSDKRKDFLNPLTTKKTRLVDVDLNVHAVNLAWDGSLTHRQVWSSSDHKGKKPILAYALRTSPTTWTSVCVARGKFYLGSLTFDVP